MELLWRYQSLPCIAPPEVEDTAGPTEPEISNPSKLGAKNEDLIASPASWAPWPGSPELVIVRSLKVVDESTKYSLTPTVVES